MREVRRHERPDRFLLRAIRSDPRSPNHGQHDPGELGALALGLLDPARTRAVEEHLATCAACRRDLEDLTAVTDLLGEVPPEALLEGPPDSDLVLQRTLRQIRAETAAAAQAPARPPPRRGRGRGRGRCSAAASPSAGRPRRSPWSSPPPRPRAGAVTMRGDGVPGVTMAAVVSPAAGWVRVSTNVRGIPAGQRCRVVVLTRDGRPRGRRDAGSPRPGARREGTQVDGAAIVAPDHVAGMAVENEAGEEFVVLRT